MTKKINIKKNLRGFVLISVVIILAISSIAMTIENATGSIEISDLQKKELKLVAEKRNLQEDLVKTLSLGQLSEKSLELGFVKPGILVYVAPNEPVAKLP